MAMGQTDSKHRGRMSMVAKIEASIERGALAKSVLSAVRSGRARK